MELHNINPILQKYIPLVEFLGNILGKNSEVVLHDLCNLDNSIIAISNSHVSGRTVGAPITNFALKMIRNEKNNKNKKFILNYNGYSKFNRELKSSTFFIRDNKDTLIGLLCINTDETIFHKLKDITSCFENNFNILQPEPNNLILEDTERFTSSIEEIVENAINDVLNMKDKNIDDLNQYDRLEIIANLNSNGVFLLKGTVTELAKQLKISEPTIYRYLQKIKNM